MSHSVAKWISEVTFPAIVVAVALAVCAFQSADSLGLAVRDWLVSAAFSSGFPTLFVALGVRRGRLSNHQVPDRSQRLAPILFTLGSSVLGLVLLIAISATMPVVDLYVCGVILGGVLGALTLRIKVSAHAGILVGAIVALALVTTVWLLVAMPLLVPVWWARRRLEAHTAFQLAVGAAVGAIVPVATILVLRLQ